MRGMIRKSIIAAVALFAATPAAAQSTTQAQIDERYDRALAAGYKALMLCSATAHSWRESGERDPVSIERYELTGIDPRFAPYMNDLEFVIHRSQGRVERISHVTVDWSETMPARIAYNDPVSEGCVLLPIGRSDWQAQSAYRSLPAARNPSPPKFTGAIGRVFDDAMGDLYGRDTRTTALVVHQAVGKPRYERYAEGFSAQTPQRTWSVAKSIAATLVGAAVYRGEATINAAAEIGAGETDPRAEIKLDHLLRMASGRYSDTPGGVTDALYWGGGTVAETAAHWPLVHEPGTVFRYANNDTLMATRVISETFAEHPPKQFFERLGMHQAVAETDWRGEYILSSQVWASARDLAQLGRLYLNAGVTQDGTRILPEGWLEYVSAPSGPQPDGPFGYGAGFWLLNNSEGVPPDTIAAIGNRGQFLVIIPSRDVVIVRRGEDLAGSRFDIAAFTRDVLASLES